MNRKRFLKKKLENIKYNKTARIGDASHRRQVGVRLVPIYDLISLWFEPSQFGVWQALNVPTAF